MAKNRQSLDISKIINLLYTNGSITRNGCYTLSSDIAEKSLSYLLETGNNALLEYDQIVYATWANYSQNFEGYSEETFNLLENFIEGKLFWKPEEFASEEIQAIKENIRLTIANNAINNSYQKRRTQSIVNNKKNKHIVIEKDGGKCKKCKSSDNLTIDHIVPIKKGGRDNIENLQLLCRSCNSKKGAK